MKPNKIEIAINIQYDGQNGMAITDRPAIKRQTLLMNKAEIRIRPKKIFVPLKRSLIKPNAKRPITFDIPMADRIHAAFVPSTFDI